MPAAAPDAANAGGRGGGRGGPQRLGPLKEDMQKWIEANKGRVRGKIVLIGKAAVVPVNFDAPVKRQPDDVVKRQFDPANPNGGRGWTRWLHSPRRRPNPLHSRSGDRTDRQHACGKRRGDARERCRRAEGIIVAQQHRGYDPATAVPTVILRNDDFGRVERLLDDGDDVKLQFDIRTIFIPKAKPATTSLPRFPVRDKADEIVMLGGHLDSWHSATGATDNAIGCSIMMEAARLIQSAGIKPRRTIRVALWSGEEEGLLGSLAYVKQHFGTAEDPKPEWSRLDAYFNVDTGTGRIRGAGVFGPAEAAAVLRPVLSQFEEWGVGGASSSSSRAVGGTDSTSFNNAGLPGIGMSQDPIEYNSMTHHTNLDTYERIIPDDVKKDAVIVAAQVLHLANRDEMLPRFTKEKMPAPVAVRPF